MIFGPLFYGRLIAGADTGHFHPEWAIDIAANESGLSPIAFNVVDHDAAGRPVGAHGLTQLMTSTLKNMGLSDDEAAKFQLRPAEDQIPYALRYFEYWRTFHKLPTWSSRAQMYAANYVPARLGRGTAPGTVLADKSDGKIFSMNAGLSRDGKTITLADLEFDIVRAIGRCGARYTGIRAELDAAEGPIDIGNHPVFGIPDLVIDQADRPFATSSPAGSDTIPAPPPNA